LIVGGGPSGLFLAHLLRSYEVPFLLIEAQTPEQRFKHPQAHFLNTRTMEILKHGLSYCNINNNDNNDSPYSKAKNTNDVYQKLREAMPPVEEWKSFRFGPDMIGTNSNGEDNLMAEVIHPVERPLMAEEDANGRLVMGPIRQQGFQNDNVKTVNNNDFSIPTNDHDGLPLSSESVGHLAQHTFCRILYDALVKTTQTTITTPNRMLNSSQNNEDKQHDGNIIYGQRATEFDWNENTGRWTVKCDQGEIFEDIESIVAADGATSTIRRNLFSDIIPPILSSDGDTSNDPTMIGTPNLQRLMNVHFTVSGDATVETIGKEVTTEEQIKIPPAMLYTVFHPDVLAMVVRHGPGDYVLQIPYFKPYQTPEEDFTIDKVHKMVQSALGGRDNFTIKSIRPWTMGSLVARKYYSDNGVFLVGDAAHVFPPAGGFGMNTGLQDVYSLAWRLASSRKQHHQQEQQSQQKEQSNDDEATNSSAYDPSFPYLLSTVGPMYERERQPVARRNAALSVRNYRRVLNVMRSCYLDDRHPALLIQALNATASFVSLEIRRNTFRALLRTALSPLSQLQTSPNGVYARTIKANLRSLLGSGQGLPLLFPKHELDFSYRHESNKDEGETINAEEVWSKDSVASSPRLAVGALFPHVVASVSPKTFRQFPRLLPIDDENINGNVNDDDRLFATAAEPSRKVSTRDLALQLATEKIPCAFCLLEIVNEKTASMDTSSQGDDDPLLSLQQTLETSIGLSFFLPCRVIVSANKNNNNIPLKEIYQESICTMYVDNPQWESLNLLPEKIIDQQRIFVVIRPDGHVAAISDDDHLDDLILDTRSVLV
jgi:2-polyprenyl-6-methoxyphenol hydroxylase-like FAD-dependent oxidoreductase